MPTTTSTERPWWRRSGPVADQIAEVVRERRRLLAIRQEVVAAYQTELAELRAVYDERLAYLDGQLAKLNFGAAAPRSREVLRELER